MEKTPELLCYIYKNVKMGSDAIVDLLPKVKDRTAERIRKICGRSGKAAHADGNKADGGAHDEEDDDENGNFHEYYDGFFGGTHGGNADKRLDNGYNRYDKARERI